MAIPGEDTPLKDALANIGSIKNRNVWSLKYKLFIIYSFISNDQWPMTNLGGLASCFKISSSCFEILWGENPITHHSYLYVLLNLSQSTFLWLLVLTVCIHYLLIFLLTFCQQKNYLKSSRRYGPLRRPTSSSCGGLSLRLRFFSPISKKKKNSRKENNLEREICFGDLILAATIYPENVTMQKVLNDIF